MELPVSLPDDVVESINAKIEAEEAKLSETSSKSGSESGSTSVDPILKWIEKKNLFISLEREEDAQQTEQALAVLPIKDLVSKGLALRNLVVNETRTGLWGRMIMTLTRQQTKDGSELPTHRFSPGDIVCIRTSSSQKTAGNDDNSVRGIVYKVANDKIQVALSAKPISLQNAQGGAVSTSRGQESADNDAMNIDYNGRVVTMVLVGNDTTFKRMETSLKRLEQLHTSNGMSDALKVLFGIKQPQEIQLSKYLPLETRFTSAKMNESQIEAIAGALASKELFLIHGPPGTGKTTVLIEYILQAVRREGQRLLVCAPSNVAVDNIVERLAPFTRGGSKSLSKMGTTSNPNSSSAGHDGDLKIVRIGHPARVQSVALNFTVEEQYRQSNGFEVFQALQEDMDKKAKEISKETSFGAKRQLRREWNDMRKDLKKVSIGAMKKVVFEANVVLATCTGADDKLLRDAAHLFDVVVVDEAAQALDPIIMIPLLKSKKIVLAGDHLQLPPTIKSTKAIEKSLCTTTFFERSIRKFPAIGRLLSVQYRMNNLIMQYSSKSLYKGKLTADDSVKEHDLEDLVCDRESKKPSSSSQSSSSSSASNLKNENGTENSDENKGENNKNKGENNPQSKDDYLKHPLILVDTAGCSFDESGGENESKSNEGEAKVVLALVSKLINDVGLSPSDVGIISPYNAQVDLLRGLIRSDPTLTGDKNSSVQVRDMRELEISSVDSFQGREKEVIIYTLVRSNARRNVGFLSSDQRTNVAITRAKRLLIVVADTETCGSHKFLRRLFDFCEQSGQYWSAAEFEQTYEAVDHTDYSKKGKKKGKQSNKNSKAPTTKPKATSSANNASKVDEKEGTTAKDEPKVDETKLEEVEVDDDEEVKIPASKPTLFEALAELSIDNSKKNTLEEERDQKGGVEEKEDENSENSEKIEEIEEISHEEVKVTQEVTQEVTKETSSSAPPSETPSTSTSDAKKNNKTNTGPPQDYRDAQKAKFEAQKAAAKKTSSLPTPVSPYAAVPRYSPNSSEARFGIQSNYIPQHSQHAPKLHPGSTNPKKSTASSSSSTQASKGPAPPIAVKKSLLKLDDDEFLESLIKEAETCYMRGCKASTKVMSETCRFCKHVYCLKHMGSETHGCGEDAKREGIAAAKQKSVDLRLRAAAAPVINGSSTMKPAQKKEAAKNLAKKMEAQKEQRTAKKPSAKK